MLGRLSVSNVALVLLLNCIQRSCADLCGTTLGWGQHSYEPVLRGVQINGPTSKLGLEFYNKTLDYWYNQGDQYCPLYCAHSGRDGKCLDGDIITESHCKTPYYTTGYSVDYFSEDNSLALVDIKRVMYTMPCDNIPFTPGPYFYISVVLVLILGGGLTCLVPQDKLPCRPAVTKKAALLEGSQEGAQGCPNCNRFQFSNKRAGQKQSEPSSHLLPGAGEKNKGSVKTANNPQKYGALNISV